MMEKGTFWKKFAIRRRMKQGWRVPREAYMKGANRCADGKRKGRAVQERAEKL